MNENERESMSEDCDPRRKDKDVRISPMQFLRDREMSTRGAKQGVIIIDDNDEKEYWFGWLGYERMYIDFEEKFWYKAFGLIKE